MSRVILLLAFLTVSVPTRPYGDVTPPHHTTLCIRSRSFPFLRFFDLDTSLVTMPERTTTVLLDDNFFTTKTTPRKFCMDDHTTTLRICKNSSCLAIPSTLAKNHIVVAASHGFGERNRVTTITRNHNIGRWPVLRCRVEKIQMYFLFCHVKSNSIVSSPVFGAHYAEFCSKYGVAPTTY